MCQNNHISFLFLFKLTNKLEESRTRYFSHPFYSTTSFLHSSMTMSGIILTLITHIIQLPVAFQPFTVNFYKTTMKRILQFGSRQCPCPKRASLTEPFK